MFSAHSILVDIDAVAGLHPALETALRVAQRSSARLKLVDVVPDVPWLARKFACGGVERDLVSYREEHLRSIASKIATRGLRVETAVLRGRPGLALSREVIESKHDLLVRTHGRAGSLEERQFGAKTCRSCGSALARYGSSRQQRRVHPSGFWWPSTRIRRTQRSRI